MEYIGKKLIVIFEDGQNHASKKVGICTDRKSYEVCLDNKHIIPQHRLWRMEVVE